MRVIIEVHSGPLQGRRFVVRDSQVMSFGSTEEADAAVTGDDAMSAIHFSITSVASECTLRDAESTNGTRVNGEFVKQADLHNGDLITAGRTQFRVVIEGGAPRLAAKNDRPTAVVVDRRRVVMDPSAARPSFGVELCTSGLTLVTGGMFGEREEPAAVSAISLALARRLPQYLIIDFRKAETPIPDQLGDLVPLFDWIPPEVAATNSPLIIPPTAALDSAGLLEKAWDKDAAVVIYSEQDAGSLVEHLRRATRINLCGAVPAREHGQGMLGYCWPSVLAPLLAFRPPGFVGALLAGIDAVLIEVPDLPGTWQIYSREGFPDVLVSIGFRQRRDEELPPVVTPIVT